MHIGGQKIFSLNLKIELMKKTTFNDQVLRRVMQPPAHTILNRKF